MSKSAAILFSLFSALYGGAFETAGENPSPFYASESNPALSRLGRSIIFYASFDGHEKAEIAPGSPAPQGDAKWAEASKTPSNMYSAGVFGKGLRTDGYAIYYAYSKPALGSSGSIALWMKAEVLKHAGTYYWPVNLQAAEGKYGVMFGRMGDPRNKEVLYAHMAGSSAISGSMANWKPGEWHLFVVNWDSGGVEISLDGHAPVRASLKAPLQSAAGGFTVRLSGASDDTFVLDELLVLDVPLKGEDIRRLYEDGRGGSAEPAD